MRIGILTAANHHIGSFRLRADVVTRELRGFGHSVYVGPTLLDDRDVQIRTKMWEGKSEALLEAKEKGQAIVFDLCDDHSAREGWREQTAPVVEAADVLTAGSIYIAELFRREFNRRAIVVEDAYEEAEAPASYSPGERMRALWYGHNTNAKPVLALAPEIERRATLRTVCNANLPGVDCRQWSPAAQEQALAWCDVVVIPVNLEDKVPNGLAKTAARVVGALRRGKFPIAGRIASYEQFEKWIYLGDIIEGLDWIKSQPRQEILNRIEHAQSYVRATFSPRHIAKHWERVCIAALAARKKMSAVEA